MIMVMHFFRQVISRRTTIDLKLKLCMQVEYGGRLRLVAFKNLWLLSWMKVDYFFASDVLWGRDEYIKFWGQKVTME